MEERYVRHSVRVQRREQEDCIGTVAAILKPRTPGVLLINRRRSRQDRAQIFPAVVVGNGSQTPLVACSTNSARQTDRVALIFCRCDERMSSVPKGVKAREIFPTDFIISLNFLEFDSTSYDLKVIKVFEFHAICRNYAAFHLIS